MTTWIHILSFTNKTRIDNATVVIVCLLAGFVILVLLASTGIAIAGGEDIETDGDNESINDLEYEIIEIEDIGYVGVERYRVQVVTPTPCEFTVEDAIRVNDNVFDEVDRANWISIEVYSPDDDIEWGALRVFDYLPSGDRDMVEEEPSAAVSEDPRYEYDMAIDMC